MRETDDSPPQDKRAEVLTPVLSLRAPNVLSLRAPNELNPHTKEREQSLARELNLRAPDEESAEALDSEMSLRAADKTLPLQAGMELLNWTTMRANSFRGNHCDKRPDTSRTNDSTRARPEESG